MVRKRGFSSMFGRKRGKRGLSDVVTTLLIILLAIVAIGIIWVVVRNVIQGGTEQIALSQKCINVDFNSASVLPVSGQAGSYSITLARGSSGDPIAGVKITLFNSTENSGIIEFGIGLNALETKTKQVSAGILNANKFEITPYFTDDSGREQLCPQTRSFTLGASGVASPQGNGQGNGEGGICNNDNICSGQENSINCPNDCGNQNPLCGNGGIDGNEQCDDGNTINGDGCSDVCTIEPEPSCDTQWSPPEDSGVVCDGGANCMPNCICGVGFSPDGSGGCTLNSEVDGGTISSVWPSSGGANRFQSLDLPTNQVDLAAYTTYSVSFTNSLETGCFGISSALYYPDLGKSEVSLNTAFPTLANIDTGDDYHLWEAPNCGQ